MPKAEPVEHVVCGGRLQIGGRWYFNGQHVKLDPKDAEIYEARGMTRPVINKSPPADPERQRETISPQQVGIQTKDEPPVKEDFAAPKLDAEVLPPVEKVTMPPPPPAPAPSPAPAPLEPSPKEHGNGKHARKQNR